MRALSLLLLALAACGGHEDVGPCTDCPAVGGKWFETRPRQETTCANGDRLWMEAANRRVVELAQDGAHVSVAARSMSGLLRKDMTVRFDPYVDYAIDEATGAHVPGVSSLSGVLYVDGDRQTMNFTFTFIEDANGCRLDATSGWARE